MLMVDLNIQHPTSNTQHRTGKQKAEMAGKATQSHYQATPRPVDSQTDWDPQATLMRPSCDPHATLKPPQCDPKAPTRLPQSLETDDGPHGLRTTDHRTANAEGRMLNAEWREWPCVSVCRRKDAP